MLSIQVSKEEMTLITMMRKAPAYSLIRIEKRPTAENREGDYSRVTIESSTLLKDLIVLDIPLE